MRPYTSAQKEGNKLAFHINRISVHTFLGDYNQAITEAKKTRDFAPYADYRRSFYEGLAAFAAARSATGRSRRKLLSVANKALRETQTWASKGSPNMVALLQAELAAIRGKVQAALWLFDKSIRAVHTEGLAHERLARYHQFLGNDHSAVTSFECSRECYRAWGADAVVSRIDRSQTKMWICHLSPHTKKLDLDDSRPSTPSN
jgi:hypothetical protein